MGFDEQGGLRVHAPTQAASAKDAPSQTHLKERQPGQGTIEELAVRDFKADLEARERKHFKLDAIEDFERAWGACASFLILSFSARTSTENVHGITL